VIRKPAVTAPDWLSPEARAEWDRLAPLLAAALTPLDRDTLAVFVTALARLAKAEAEIARIGEVVRGATGAAVVNPWCAVARTAADQVHRFGSELGLSPAARARLAGKASKAAAKAQDEQQTPDNPLASIRLHA